MKEYMINDKKLPIPSFFQVYNFGGGCGDKLREIVYSELTKDIPALLNYSYLVYNKKKEAGSWGRPWTSNLGEFDNIASFLDYVRSDLIRKRKNIFQEYVPDDTFLFKEKVILLDSGAAIIVKKIASTEVNYDSTLFIPALLKHMIQYYDFAHKYKFDLVVGFDLGGKYTFKDNETKDKKLIEFYDSLDKDYINRVLLEESVKYLKKHPNYYPKVLATVHGKTPKDYSIYAQDILTLEKEYSYNFWGFALGGVASCKGIDSSWFDGIKIKGKIQKNALIPARAAKIVSSIVGNRPIHALGCGGFSNIPLNYYNGATSFDAASPARRVGDGNALSSIYTFEDEVPKKVKKDVKFSKVLIGGFTKELKPLNDGKLYEYVKLNNVSDNTKTCGCPSCNKITSFKEVKELYYKKSVNIKDKKSLTINEPFFYARQIMNIHSIWQHRYLCELAMRFNNIDELYSSYCEIELLKKLKDLNTQLKKI